ncbi:MAG: hypothetical protein AB1750_14370 [Chloroflexota bacterium]
MMSEEKQIIRRVVEHYLKTGQSEDDQVKVTRLPDGKTSFIEQTSGDGRSIMLDEYQVDGKVIWAAYSSRSGVVYLSRPR